MYVRTHLKNVASLDRKKEHDTFARERASRTLGAKASLPTNKRKARSIDQLAMRLGEGDRWTYSGVQRINEQVGATLVY